MRTIAHIVNPFVAPAGSDLAVAQPLTFMSMIKAKEFACHEVDVSLFAAMFSEDVKMLPPGFLQTRNLERSVLDLANFRHSLKLPLIADILERLYSESEAEYLIYTNVDIGLYPDFYSRVNRFIDQGHDAFIINRRRIPARYTSVVDLERVYRETGKSHPGFDCFVFHRNLVPKMRLDGICIGVPFVEISFSQNLFAVSKTFKLFEKEKLTFHLGMEIFRKRAPREYFRYNRRQFWKLIKVLEPAPDLKKFPFAEYNWFARLVLRALHPCVPIRLVLKLELNRLLGSNGLR